MKKKIKMLFSLLFILSFFMVDVVYASGNYLLNEYVVSGYKQVTSVGGENYTSDGVSVSKIIEEADVENYFDITLKVNTLEKIEEIVTDPDLAIVIVMDVSHTMVQYNVDGTKHSDYPKKTTRYEAAMEAGEKFIKDFATYSTGVEAVRQIGFVGFNTNASQIFKLQDCKDSTLADNLIKTMKTKTQEIVYADDYSISHDRFTNIEAGLKRANAMLNETDVKNKYIIFISDGFPTTYIKSGYTGYDPYTSNATFSTVGKFYNDNTKKACSYGTSYSDLAARRARELATKIKEKGTKIFSVGTGLDYQTTISTYLNNEKNLSYSVIDTDTNDYEIGNSRDDYKNWLKSSIGSGYYFDTTDATSMNEAYEEIFKQIKEYSKKQIEEAWIAEDPMGINEDVTNVEFIGLYDDLNNLHDSLDVKLENQSNTATFKDNKISWDLKNSIYKTTEEENVVYYTYEIKYRVRLKNEVENFDLTKHYKTNGDATLKYIIRENGVLSDEKQVNFEVPSVVGYLGKIDFIKKSSLGNISLSNARFKLTHDEDCPCHNERKHPTIEDIYASSNEEGEVVIENIPSGHKYVLTEVEAPHNHLLSNETYKIEVSYGEVSGLPEDKIIINDIKKTNLSLKKTVIGHDEDLEYTFLLEVFYNDYKLEGTYNYIISNENNDKTGSIDLKNDVIKLKNGEVITIMGLPINATYKVKELSSGGYNVSHKINLNDEESGEEAICNKENNCSLKEENNKIEFINTKWFILPKTGSNNRLNMKILGSVFMFIPIIYGGYEVIKKLKYN